MFRGCSMVYLCKQLPVDLETERCERWEHGQWDVWTVQAGEDFCVSVWNLQGALWGLEAETARGVFINGGY